MSGLSYALTHLPTVLTHGSGAVLTFRDGLHTDEHELQAHVRSGEYFATLATSLDQVSQSLDTKNEAESAILQRFINDLLYLQRNYMIVKKDKTPSKLKDLDIS